MDGIICPNCHEGKIVIRMLHHYGDPFSNSLIDLSCKTCGSHIDIQSIAKRKDMEKSFGTLGVNECDAACPHCGFTSGRYHRGSYALPLDYKFESGVVFEYEVNCLSCQRPFIIQIKGLD